MNLNNICKSDEKGNIIDAITDDTIPPERVIILGEGEGRVCTDIKTIYKDMVSNNLNKPRNPFTRLDLSRSDSEKVIEYGKSLKVEIPVYVGNNEPYTITVFKGINYGNLIIEVHNYIVRHLYEIDIIMDDI